MCRMIRSIHIYIYIFIIHKIIGQHLSNTYVTLIHYTILSRSISFHHLVWDGISATFRPWIFGCFPIDHHFSPYVNGKERHVYPMVHQNFPNEKICKLDYFMGHDFAANHVVHRFRFLIKWPFRLGILYDLYDIPLSIVCCQMPLHSPNNVKTNGLLTRVARTHYR